MKSIVHSPSHRIPSSIIYRVITKTCIVLLISGLCLLPAAARDSARQKLELGQRMYFNGNIDGAIHAFQSAVALNPNLWEAHQNLANMYMEKGNIPSVIQEYREVLKLKPTDKDVWLMLGNLLQTQNDLGGAAEAYKRAIQFGSDVATTFNALGLVLMQQNELGGAVYNFIKAIEKQPKFPEAQLALGIALFRSGDKIQDLQAIDKAIEQKGRYPEAHNVKGDVLAAEGNIDEALEEYNTAIKEAPSFAPPWLSAGNLRFFRKEYALAAEAYAHAAQLLPNSKDAYYGLGLALEQQGRTKDAMTALTRGLFLDQDPQTTSKIQEHLDLLRRVLMQVPQSTLPVEVPADTGLKLLRQLAPLQPFGGSSSIINMPKLLVPPQH